MLVMIEALLVALKLGVTSFGGPVAHLGYFHHEFVVRRRWLDDAAYGELLGLGQCLPGPTSSQLILGIGTARGGILTGIAAWVGFALPSALVMMGAAWVVQSLPPGYDHFLGGLKVVALVVVAQAVLSMGKSMAKEQITASIAFLTAGLVICWPSPLLPVALLLLSGVLGRVLKLSPVSGLADLVSTPIPLSKTAGVIFLTAFAVMAFLLPVLRSLELSPLFALADAFFRPGALVFGGGHIVLPLLDKEVVSSGWVTKDSFLSGYGLAQALPGPLFTFAGYLGWIVQGPAGALVALVSIFLPGFLLFLGVLPFWSSLMRRQGWRSALAGINASVVGLLGAALWNPIARTALTTGWDFALAALLFVALTQFKVPVWLIVIAGVIGQTLKGA